MPLMFKDGSIGRIYNSLPYFGSNGGIITNSDSARDALIEKYNSVTKYAESSVFIENPFAINKIRPIHNFSTNRINQINQINKEQDLINLINCYTSNKRNDIRRAIKAGVKVTIDNSTEAKNFLYQTHLKNMKAIGGKAKEKILFDLIYNTYDEGEGYNIFIGRINDLMVAGLLVLYFKNITEYYTPVIDAVHRKSQPLALVIHNAMINSQNKNITIWNWGANGEALNSIYRFKKSWGALDRQYKYWINVSRQVIDMKITNKILDEYRGFYIRPLSENEK